MLVFYFLMMERSNPLNMFVNAFVAFKIVDFASLKIVLSEINDGSEGVECVCANGSVSAQVAIVCTNAQIANLCPILKNKVDPVQAKCSARLQFLLSLSGPFMEYGYDYWRQCPDGSNCLGRLEKSRPRYGSWM